MHRQNLHVLSPTPLPCGDRGRPQEAHKAKTSGTDATIQLRRNPPIEYEYRATVFERSHRQEEWPSNARAGTIATCSFNLGLSTKWWSAADSSAYR